jgi:hypothetical protein
LARQFTAIFLKNEIGVLHIFASPGQPQGNSLCTPEGIQAFTVLVVFLLYYDKKLTKIISYVLGLSMFYHHKVFFMSGN